MRHASCMIETPRPWFAVGLSSSRLHDSDHAVYNALRFYIRNRNSNNLRKTPSELAIDLIGPSTADAPVTEAEKSHGGGVLEA
ncbi:hypothetical protein EST38_g10832 [Candolleomyces aberdarensis]|uniref:Uncharacterized protein n=1 Tax=Candolleomyces aberdarensis TaxID=2316362 RepID=A0A4Q2D802_9AGAR|nr:hypothetical protein EST38_g10832 [Candolleomyces aberdarensis]